MSGDENAERQQRLTYTALTGTFFALFAVFNLLTRRRGRGGDEGRAVEPFDLALLGLSSYRMGRLISYDLVMQPYRAPFTETVPDPTGAGDTIQPKGAGWRRALGELICCPICAGTWISAILTYGLELAPRPTRVMLTIMSATGLAELVNALTEWLSWGGQASREHAGSESMAKAKGRH
ncbi:MAG: DUF1360 domain-containing protein [Anaerolineae bacterium]